MLPFWPSVNQAHFDTTLLSQSDDRCSYNLLVEQSIKDWRKCLTTQNENGGNNSIASLEIRAGLNFATSDSTILFALSTISFGGELWSSPSVSRSYSRTDGANRCRFPPAKDLTRCSHSFLLFRLRDLVQHLRQECRPNTLTSSVELLQLVQGKVLQLLAQQQHLLMATTSKAPEKSC